MGVLLYPAWDVKVRVFRDLEHPRGWHGRWIDALRPAIPHARHRGRSAVAASEDVHGDETPTLTGTRARGRHVPAAFHLAADVAARVEAARAAIPVSDEEWKNVRGRYAPAQRAIDRQVALAEVDLAQARAEVARLEAENAHAAPWWETLHGRAQRRVAQLEADLQAAQAAGARPSFTGQQMVPAAVLRPQYPVDVNGSRLAPPAYEQQLARVMEVGQALDDALQASIAADPESASLRRMLAGELSVQAIQRVPNPNVRAAFYQRRADALRQLCERQQELTLDMLHAVRPMGGVEIGARAGDPSRVRNLDGSPSGVLPAREDWRERLIDAGQFFPADWLRLSSAAGDLPVMSARRAFYRNGDGGFLAMPTAEFDSVAYDGAHTDRTEESIVHELGHRMEDTVPGLKELEFTYLRQRSMGSGGELEEPRPLRDLTGSRAYLDYELAYPDHWANPYAGKTYETVTRGVPTHTDPASMPAELFAAGLADLFGMRRDPYDSGPELRHFTLGALATLAPGGTAPAGPAAADVAAADVPDYAARQAEVRRLIGRGVPRTTRDLGGAGLNHLLIYRGGKVVRKRYEGRNAARQVDAEVLTAHVLDAVGAPTAAVVTDPAKPGTVYVEYLEHPTLLELNHGGGGPSLNAVLRGPDGHLIGLADVLTLNFDGNAGNVLVSTDGTVYRIDHGGAFGEYQDVAGRVHLPSLSEALQQQDDPFIGYLVAGDDLRDEIRASDIDFTAIRLRLEALRPEFEARGRLAWFTAMMERFDDIENRVMGE